MRRGRHLIHLIKTYQIEYEDIGLGDCDETIILKSERSEFWDESEIIEYENNDQTNNYRKEMTEINLWIKEAELNYLMPIIIVLRLKTEEGHLMKDRAILKSWWIYY